MPEEKANGWEREAKLVKHELERLSEGQQCMLAKLTEHRVETAKEIAALKAKMAMWSALTGLAAGGLMSVLLKVLL